MGSDPLPSTLTSTKPTPIPTHELDDEHERDDSALLSFNTDSSSSATTSKSLSNSNNKPLLISLILITCISLSLASAFAYLFFSSRSTTPASSSSTTATSATASSPSPAPAPSPSESHARPLTKLNRPKVLLISSDGFRFGYQFKTPTPNIARLIANGTEAETGLIPVFPSLTFPNHYSIATGLYPAHHGIINNHFLDPHSGDSFYMGNIDPKWWLGEPLWETVVNNGLNAATYFWPGTQGHKVGADDPQITEAVSRIDRMIGRLISGLEQRGVFDDVTIIMVGDHGMVTTCDKKLIFLDDLAPWIDIPENWVISHTPLLAITPPSGYSPSDVVAKMNQGLSSGKVENGKHLKVYLKEDLPSRLHYSGSDRIPPVIGLLGEGFKVRQKRSKNKECGGSHGYDNEFFSMRSIFIGHGPQFARGRKIPSFENVQIYNLVTRILNIKGAPNNGSASFPEDVLLSAA
ncbi:hypothetical protein PIB30_024925 [Stylosanthes scabra]|uniref:Uncharacterized protein n=1 Tax=Stylosanthes scabra TaxID=79078 RepID=A0ABU6UD64_9FABA|nr:hypothetical protein [Stylosanthes scabra]